MNKNETINLMDLPYDCLYHIIYNSFSVRTMHRRIKLINVYFHELVHKIVSENNFNLKFIEKQQIFLYESETEIKDRIKEAELNMLKITASHIPDVDLRMSSLDKVIARHKMKLRNIKRIHADLEQRKFGPHFVSQI